MKRAERGCIGRTCGEGKAIEVDMVRGAEDEDSFATVGDY